jgi:dihydrolipoamide dehydrogenase
VDTFDIAIIGAGPGGYPAAVRAAQLGASVALIEKEELGGACLNWGCIPSKTLIGAAQLVSRLQSSNWLKVEGAPPSIDYPRLVEHKNQTVQQLRKGVDQLLSSNGVNLIRGTASFEQRNCLRVKTSRDSTARSITAEKVIIATGAGPQTSSGFPQHPRILNSRSFLDLEEHPGTAMIVGGGVIGCEFACFLAQLNVKVTLVEASDDILTGLDNDVRRELRRHLEKSLGIRFLTGAKVDGIETEANGVHIRSGEQSVLVDLLIDATGRKPASSALRLEKTQLETSPEGYIPIDEYGQTPIPSIYAIGDVTGGAQLAHAATSQGLTVAENACLRSHRRIEKNIPCCIFTNPEIGSVGLTEAEAKRQGREIKTGKFRFAALGKAVSLGEGSGFAKWIADPGTNQLLGAAAVGPHATELIAEATLAIGAELTAEELVRTVHAHPTLAEGWFESAGVLLGRPLHSIPRKR